MANHIYSYESNISAPAADVFAYHERFAALQRLIPPWESVRVISNNGSIQNGDSKTIRMNLGPFKIIWEARHQDYQANRQFVDVQVKGPLKYWKHTHSFRSIDINQTNLKDTVQLELPFGVFWRNWVYPKVLKKLNRLFTYRHVITQNDLKDWMQLKSFPVSKVAITGGNGLIGSELAVFLQAQGHEVVILSRSGKSNVFGVRGVNWDPDKQFIDSKSLGDVDCWIHLAGENVAKGRWTKTRIKRLRDSRVKSTKFLVEYILKQKNLPKVFITASGTGYYPSSPEVMTEDAVKGEGILAGICSDWEDASTPLIGTSIRRVVLRTGIVLSKKGGTLEKLLPSFNLGVGGPIGSGKQIWSWIAMEDLLRIYNLAAKDPKIEGTYNAVAPIASTNKEFADVIGSALRRPTLVRTPSWIVKLVLGRMADEAILASQNIVPKRLNESGFNFNFQDLELAVSHCLGTY